MKLVQLHRTFCNILNESKNSGQIYEDNLFVCLNALVHGKSKEFIFKNPLFVSSEKERQKMLDCTFNDAEILYNKFGSIESVRQTGKECNSRKDILGIESGIKPVGKLVSDIILTLRNGKEEYISVKSSSGYTLANLSPMLKNDKAIITDKDKSKNISIRNVNNLFSTLNTIFVDEDYTKEVISKFFTSLENYESEDDKSRDVEMKQREMYSDLLSDKKFRKSISNSKLKFDAKCLNFDNIETIFNRAFTSDKLKENYYNVYRKNYNDIENFDIENITNKVKFEFTNKSKAEFTLPSKDVKTMVIKLPDLKSDFITLVSPKIEIRHDHRGIYPNLLSIKYSKMEVDKKI